MRHWLIRPYRVCRKATESSIARCQCTRSPVWGTTALEDRPRTNREDVRDAGAVHAHAVHGVSFVHRRAVVGDDDKLYLSGELGQQIYEALHIRLVECRVNFVEDAKRSRVDL